MLHTLPQRPQPKHSLPTTVRVPRSFTTPSSTVQVYKDLEKRKESVAKIRIDMGALGAKPPESCTLTLRMVCVGRLCPLTLVVTTPVSESMLQGPRALSGAKEKVRPEYRAESRSTAAAAATVIPAARRCGTVTRTSCDTKAGALSLRSSTVMSTAAMLLRESVEEDEVCYWQACLQCFYLFIHEEASFIWKRDNYE